MLDAPLGQIVRDRIGPDSKLALLLASLERDYSIVVPSVWGSYAGNPGLFCTIGEQICSGLVAKFSELTVDDFCRYDADFTIEQNRHQRAYVRTGIDISGEAVEISRGMAAATNVAPSTTYLTGNAFDWRGERADRVIAGELLEHLNQPQMLMDSLFNTLVPGWCAFVTAALTAAHMDHVWEFKTSQEVFDMAAKAGLELKGYLEAAPLVVPKNTDKIPRVLAMVLARPLTS